MEDDILNEQQEEQKETPQIDDNQEEEEEQSLEDMFENDEDLYKIEDYDLSKYKDNFDLANESTREELSTYAKTLKEKGFTQEQVEWLIEDRLNDTDEEETADKSKVISNLKEKLTVEEKRNYKILNNYISSKLKDTDLADYREEIMTNPGLVKLINLLYKDNLNKTTNINSSVKSKEKKLSSISLQEAQQEVNRLLVRKELTDDKINELRSNVIDREAFDSLIKIIK